MGNHTFYILDVFVEEKYAGNQSARHLIEQEYEMSRLSLLYLWTGRSDDRISDNQ